MIALDTSAIVAIACSEPEEETFTRLIALKEALVGTPTLLGSQAGAREQAAGIRR